MLKTYLLKSVCKRVEKGVTSRNGRVRVMSSLLSNESLSSQTIRVNAIAHSFIPKLIVYLFQKAIEPKLYFHVSTRVVWAWKMSQAELVKVEAPIIKVPPDLLILVEEIEVGVEVDLLMEGGGGEGRNAVGPAAGPPRKEAGAGLLIEGIEVSYKKFF
ncbi:hypothetical protein Tco_1409177, partial [Tanacetum coccineum]